MSLNLAPIYQAMVRQFSAGTDSQRFAADFVEAVNDSLDDLVGAGDLDTGDLPHVSGISDSITNLSYHHSSILKSGIRYYMMMLGQVPAAGGEGFFDRARADWEMKKGEFMVRTSHDDQDDLDSDGWPENDIIGLGVKTQ